MWTIDLAVLFVQYAPERHPDAFSKIKRCVDRIRFCRPTYLIVDNRIEGGGPRESAPGVYLVGGDDSAREFSGWQRGLAEAGGLRPGYRAALFVTEAVFEPGRTFLERYGTKSLLLSFLSTSAVGRLDSYGRPGVLLGRRIDDWLCTGCFFLPRAIIERLGTLITVGEETMDLFMDREYRGGFFKCSAPLDESYRGFIVDWLTRRRYRTMTVDRGSWGEVRGKVRAMFNEALLTARIREAGYAVRSYGAKKYY